MGDERLICRAVGGGRLIYIEQWEMGDERPICRAVGEGRREKGG
jgi:hypothetical protein